jgi:Xaa-Pro aminopeptidase
MDGMRSSNVRDSAAIVKYFAFLEEELKKDDHTLNEHNGAEKLLAFRAMGELFKGPSFETISSIGPNGAIIHYKPEEDDNSKLNNDEIYLLDSGGQYLDGTTDITRTTHFGGKAPTAFQKEAYTRVLLGVIDLENAVWPKGRGFAGKDFDILARRHLFTAGLDYNHGTGHGIGSMLCVHEGPQGVNRRTTVEF